MAAPKTNFYWNKNGLEVTFKDLSSNGPTSWVWDFGDTNNSTDQNPVHTFSSPGFYSVTMTPTNGDGAGNTITLTVGVHSIEFVSDRSVWFIIDDYIPTKLVEEQDQDFKRTLLSKYQLYIAPLIPLNLVDPPIPANEVHDELKYPALVNQLIAQLVAYDLIIQGANKFLTNLGILGGNESSTTTPDPSLSVIKKIETGPSNVEWYNAESSEKVKNIGTAYSNALKKGGALDQIKENACGLSKRLRIYLPMCGQLSHSPTPPEKSPLKTDETVKANPFGLPKELL